MNIDWNLVILCTFAVIAICAVIFLLLFKFSIMKEQDNWQDISPDEYYALPLNGVVVLRYKDESGKTVMHTCHKCNLRAVIMDLQARGCSDIHILKLGR